MKTPTRRTLLTGWLAVSCTVLTALAAPEAGKLIIRDNFQAGLGDGWTFEREDRADWRTGPLGLEVRVRPGGMWGGGNNARNVMVHPIPAPTNAPIEIAVTVSNVPSAQWEQANLVWYYDAGNMVKLGQELVTGRLSIVMGREENDRARTVGIIPLDAYAVELRLQAFNNHLRGQFRTAPWREWRDVGECDLPVKGSPNASLHFYNGPANEEHWVRVNNFTVRRLSAADVDWPCVRADEKMQRDTDNPRVERTSIALPGEFTLASEVQPIFGEMQAKYEQSIYRHRDGSFGWRWDRRSSENKSPTSAGVGFGSSSIRGVNSPKLVSRFEPLDRAGAPASAPASGVPRSKAGEDAGAPIHGEAAGDGFRPLAVAEIQSLELECDAVTRLENDSGDHNFAVILAFKPHTLIVIEFDWYGMAATNKTLNDGIRDYCLAPMMISSGELRYRITGFRGTPPRVNLKAFLDDALRRGLTPQTELLGVWFGNQIWNGSRGATLVTRLDLIVNGKRHSSVPAKQSEVR